MKGEKEGGTEKGGIRRN